MKQILIMGIIAILLTSGIGVMSIQNDAFEKVETYCIEGVDNDSEGLIDNKDSDCWMKEGAIYETHPYYYDGTFSALTEQISSLADLGVNTIWLMPIWKHPDPILPPPEDWPYQYGTVYQIYDYSRTDPRYGTSEDIHALVDTVHEYDMKIIFDLVTCATPENSVIYNNTDWLIQTSLSKIKSVYPDAIIDCESIPGSCYVYCNCSSMDNGMGFAMCDVLGKIIDDDKVILTHYPMSVFGWAIDRSNPEVIDYFTNITEYYVREYDIDGFRIDAPTNQWNSEIVSGDHSILELLNSVKNAITNIKPDAILYGEHASTLHPELYEHNSPPDLDAMCEASYGYYFYIHLFVGISTSQDLVNVLSNENVMYGRSRARFVENHDTGFTDDLGRIQSCAPCLNKPLLVLISTIPDIPMIQAGQEIGAENPYLTDAPVNWAQGNYELRDFYKKVFTVRNNNNALKYGTIENVWKSGDDTYAYLREYDDEKVIAIVNFLDKQAISTLNLSFLESGTFLYDGLNNEVFMVSDPSNFEISIPAYGSRILFLKEGDEPIICIERPEEGYLYAFDQQIMPTIFGNTIILGKITIKADAFDENGIEKVEFYIDDELKHEDDEFPYEWLWNEFAIGNHEVKVIAYDNEGNNAKDKMEVKIFNVGG